MALSVIQRPDANLYVNDPPQYQEQPYYYSRWSAAFLPLVYKISNTKFPTNTEDAVDTYTAVTNNNGFAKFDLAGTAYQTYIRGQKVLIEGTVYSGVYEVIAIQGDQLTLNVAFSETDTGTANKYYDNYATLVRLYAGVPAYHPFAAQDPMTLIGTFSIAPNPSNIAVIDVADLVRQKISKDNDLTASGRPNDLDAWTCFYIEYAETYDTYTGGIPETVITNFTVDNLQGITPVSITNGSFTSSLTGWSQINGKGSSLWSWDSGSAKYVPTLVFDWSKTIYQEVNFKKSIAYKIVIDYEIDTVVFGNPINGRFSVYASNLPQGRDADLIYLKNTYNDISETKTIYFTPNEDLKYIGIAGFSLRSIKINSITAEEASANYDTAYIFASNSTRQFFDYAKNERSRYGGNMAEYVMNYNTAGILSKFLTRFEKPVLFPNYYQDISCILPQSTLDIPFTQDGLLYRVRTLDANGSELSHTDTEIVNNGDGVYRLRLDNKIGSGAKADVQLIRTITTPKSTDIYFDFTNQSDLYYSIDGNAFQMVTLPQSYLMAGISVFDNGKAVISTYKEVSGSYYVVFYLFDNGTVTYIANLIAATFTVTSFPYIKAFDENNFAAIDTPTNQLFIRRNGITKKINLSSLTITMYDVNGASMNTLFMTGVTTGSARVTIYKLDNTNTLSVFYVYETFSYFATVAFAIAGGYVFTIRNIIGDTTNSYLSKLDIVSETETTISIPYHLTYADMAFKDANNGFLLQATNIYKYTNGVVTTYTDLNSLRTSEGDTTNYKGIEHLGEGVYVIWSASHIYKYTGAWSSLGEKSATDLLTDTSYNGLYKLQTDTFEISERLPFDIDNTCTNQNMHLSWLNSLGNWEHFVFTAKKSYEKNIDDFTISSNSILANFPDNFDSETYDDKIKVDAFDVVTVRSQYVERKQLDIIAEILQSLRVQYWYSFDKKITVIVDSKKVSKYTDGDRLFAIEFDIIMPKIQTQS